MQAKDRERAHTQQLLTQQVNLVCKVVNYKITCNNARQSKAKHSKQSANFKTELL